MCRWFISWLLIFLTGSAFGQVNERLQQVRQARERGFHESQERVRNFLNSTNARSTYLGDSTSVLLVDVSPEGQPVYRITLNTGAAQTTGASWLQTPSLTGLELLGENMKVGVWDNGIVQQHIEFDSRLLSTQGDTPQEHATHVTGTLIAHGVNPLARGMAPKGSALTYHFSQDEPVMAALAKSDQGSLLFSNHSYGTATGWFRVGSGWQWTGDPAISADEDYRFGFYGERARALDEIAYSAPYYSIFWAAGNDRADLGNGSRPADCNSGTGYDCIIPDAVAKNIFTIGAINKITNYTSPASAQMGDYSSWGPTDDGRIKPDLVGAGTNLFSTSAASTNSYATLGGTSMATPNVAGSLMLVQELYSKLHGGKFMKAATLKALAIHTAKEAGAFPGPDYSFGWGVVDVAAAADFLMKENGVSRQLSERTLKNSQSMEWAITPEANKKITVTIAWTDPAGAPPLRALDPLVPMLVNDLDVRIVDAQGVSQKPWILDPINPVRQATTGDNFRDNVEKIEFQLPQAKPYKIIVSHKGQLVNDEQDFSIAITYSTTTAPSTFYWVGDTGTWSDPSHWSRSSGGTSAQTVPSSNDYVIIDENSFDGTDLDEIVFTKDESVASLRWMAQQKGVLAMSGKVLTLSMELVVSAKNEVIKNGVVKCATSTEGQIAFASGSFQDVHMQIAAGKWTWQGVANLKKIEVAGGELSMTKQTANVQEFLIPPGSTKTVDLSNTKLDINKTSVVNSQQLSLNSQGTAINCSGNDVVLDWQGVVWDGAIIFAGGNNELKGNNAIHKIDVQSAVLFSGSNEIDSLTLFAGSTLKLATNQTQRMSTPVFSGTANLRSSILSDGNASLFFTTRSKLCFDYLKINSVAALGNSVVNAGVNSELTNATNWKNVTCSELLFADFNVNFPCVGGLIELTDSSEGTPETRKWSTTRGTLVDANATNTNLFVTEAAPYTVSLSITKGAATDVVSKTITPVANTLSENEILKNGDELVSLLPSTRYQWIKDGVPITEAIARTYDSKGEEAVYQVVTYDSQCSRLSDAYVVTGVEDVEQTDVVVFPNPASNGINVQASTSPVRIELFDSVGKLVYQGNDNPVDVNSYADGFYLLVLTLPDRIIQRKILVRRD